MGEDDVPFDINSFCIDPMFMNDSTVKNEIRVCFGEDEEPGITFSDELYSYGWLNE